TGGRGRTGGAPMTLLPPWWRPRRRTTVNFPPPVWDEIEEEADVAGVGVDEMLRRLAWVGLYVRRRGRGAQVHVIFEPPNGDSERLLLDPDEFCPLTHTRGPGAAQPPHPAAR